MRDLLPSLRLYEIYYPSRVSKTCTVVEASAHRVTVRGVEDGALSQIDGFLIYRPSFLPFLPVMSQWYSWSSTP